MYPCVLLCACLPVSQLLTGEELVSSNVLMVLGRLPNMEVTFVFGIAPMYRYPNPPKYYYRYVRALPRLHSLLSWSSPLPYTGVLVRHC